MRHSIPFLLPFAALAAAQSPLVDLLSSQPDLSSLLDILTITPELVNTLSNANNITIFAPVNSAFAAIPPDTAEGVAISTRDPNGTSTLLNYHVLQGSYPSSAFQETPLYYPTLFDNRSIIFDNPRTNVTGGQNVGLFRNGSQFQVVRGELQTSNVIQADITVGGVTIHKIDEVLTIPLNASDTAERLNATAALGALTQAGLIDQLDIVPDLTLFIPNNEAFQAVGSAFAGASIETLRDVLQYHAVTGNVLFSTEVTNTTVTASNGGTLNLTVIDDDIFVNGAKVILPNVLMSDGVAHVIDSVLNPDTQAINPADLEDDDDEPATAFPGASPVPNVPFTSAVPAPTTLNTVPPLYTTASVVAPTRAVGSGNGTIPSGAAGGSTTTARPGNGTVTTGAGGNASTRPASFTGAAALPTMMAGGLWAGVLAVGAWEV
ncbi:fasciclin domain-containing protein 3 [Elsinoe australis]|uniref:Fasciclin domain-containing protein 3 n=1 Tax=Elsinoe australis TaxID=40998 RepID=A0A4U7B1Z5_9PEZI|nr:fasciclin domain-containing protein 3 [Elsinoe australis]